MSPLSKSMEKEIDDANRCEEHEKYVNNFDERAQNYKEKALDIYVTENITFWDIVINTQRPNSNIQHVSVYEAALQMYNGKSVNLKTGEGKTFCIIIAAIALFLKTNKKVYILVTNPYFVKDNSETCAKRVNLFKQKFSEEVNIRVGYVLQDMDVHQKLEVYQNSDIIYLTPSSLCFDFLENILQKNPEYICNIEFENLLIDEVDAILVDEAENPHILQTPDQISSIFDIDSTTFYGAIQEVYKSYIPSFIKNIHYEVDREIITLKPRGWKLINIILDSYPESYHTGVIWIITSCLNAICRYTENEDYLIINNKVNLLQEDTGRIYQNRQLGEGIHMVLEAISGLPPSHSSNFTLKINILQIVPMFKHVAGCSGTTTPVREQLMVNYGINSIEIDSIYKNRVTTNSPKMFWNEEEQLMNIHMSVRKIKEVSPLKNILIITSNIELADKIFSILYEYDDEMSLIFARNTEEIQSVVDRSTKPGHITIATSILGRGVSIKLEEENYGSVLMNVSLYYNTRTQIQVNGRIGRLGAPGTIDYLYSLDDPLIKERKELSQFIKNTYKQEHPIKRANRFLSLLRKQISIQSEIKLRREKEIQFIMKEITPILINLYAVKKDLHISENGYLCKLFQKIEADILEDQNSHTYFLYKNYNKNRGNKLVYNSPKFLRSFYEECTQLYRYVIDTYDYFEFSSCFVSWTNCKPAEYFKSILQEELSIHIYKKCYNILIEHLLVNN